MGIFAYKKNIWLSIIIALAIIVTTLYIIGSLEIKKAKQDITLENSVSYNQPQIPDKNVTDEILSGVLNEVAAANIIEQNQGESGLIVPSHSSIESITNKILGDFDPATFKPDIKDSTLKISDDNSYFNIVKYIRNFSTIIQKNSQLGDTPTKYTTVSDTLSSTREIYQRSLLDFYNLEVPSSLLEFHKEEISLLTGKLLAIDRIKDYTSDPIEAFLALEADTYLDQEFIKLKDKLNQYITDNNIQI